jgi:hypothetical protein
MIMVPSRVVGLYHTGVSRVNTYALGVPYLIKTTSFFFQIGVSGEFSKLSMCAIPFNPFLQVSLRTVGRVDCGGNVC